MPVPPADRHGEGLIPAPGKARPKALACADTGCCETSWRAGSDPLGRGAEHLPLPCFLACPSETISFLLPGGFWFETI